MLCLKQSLLDEISASVKESPGFIVMNYGRISANDFAKFRKKLFDSGSSCRVFKKRFFQKALQNLNIDFDIKNIKGNIGVVAVKEDFVGAAKILRDFQEEREDELSLVGAFVDGISYTASDCQEICNLPGKDLLRSQFLSLLASPLSSTLSTFESLLLSLVYCIENKKGSSCNG